MEYREIIEKRYSRRAWQELLYDIFGGNIHLNDEPFEVETNKPLAKSVFNLGRIRLTDGLNIMVYEVELADNVNIERNKRGIRDLLTSDWLGKDCVGAFMLCYRKNEATFRFSYVSLTYGLNEKREYEKQETDTTRYTYLLGEGRACRTAAESFERLKNSPQTLADITAAFSVEALTKQFYKDLFEWYSWAVNEKTGVKFPNNTAVEREGKDDIEKKIIRMITRIMFVWFIKQKELVPDRIFRVEYLKTILKDFDATSETDGSYYNAILQNLFFATLNRAIKDEEGMTRGFAERDGKDVKTLYRYEELFSVSKEKIIEMFASVPFLNGGLFECLDKTKQLDGAEICYNFDGFSRNDKKFPDGTYRQRATVPNILFFDKEKGLIEILSRYNFTVEENTPKEQTVALDPELLGKVFENLLGAYNPETKETARNESGSFYTPREVVNYMVNESLIAYLGDNEFTRELFDKEFHYDEAKKKEYKTAAIKLRNLKAFDPACGSGAFPMGLLNRIVEILQRLEPSEDVYQLKLFIIENCLYGSDIQSIAAQITKLRFFISLICDCRKDDTKSNFGIPTLPNLETKFVSADSLTAIKQPSGQLSFTNQNIEDIKAQLHTVRGKHFSAKTANEKRHLRQQDDELRQQLIEMIKQDPAFASEDAKLLASWNPYDQNGVASFFDASWMYQIGAGFDIVIGNPPYIQLQNNAGKLAKQYEGQDYQTFARTGDISCLFYERGWQLLKQGGHLCYITTNKWMRSGYGDKTRGFFAQKTDPQLLIDFGGVKVFESATVDTNILLFAKAKNNKQTKCLTVKIKDKGVVKDLQGYVSKNYCLSSFDSSDSWVILNEAERNIKRKIEAVGTPLKDWDISINYGIKTGYNDAFIITTQKREEILSRCKDKEEAERTKELIRPILRGRDIKRYSYNWADLWLICTFPARHYDIEQYPAVKEYLLSFGKERLEQTGKTYNGIKARKKTSNKWFEVQDSIAYWQDFNKEKIVYPNMTQFLPFVYDKDGYLTNQKCFFITGKRISYLTAFFNSQLFKFCFTDNFPKLGEKGRELSKIFFDKIPVLPVDETINQKFKILVEEVQKEYQTGKETEKAKKIEAEIDALVYQLYGLTEEEVAIIEDTAQSKQQTEETEEKKEV